MSQPNFDPPVQSNSGEDTGQIGQAGMFTGQQPSQGQQPEEKINPAWNGLLSKIPDQNLQKLIMPELKQWDQNYNSGLEKVHSQYAPYKPFLEAGIAPERLNEAIMVYEAMEQDPEKFVTAVANFYKVQLGQGQQEPEQQQEPQYDGGEQQPSFDLTQHPEFQRQQQIVEQLAKGYISQQEAQLAAQDDQELETELAAAREKYGEFDERRVIQAMLFDEISAEEAVQQLQAYNQQIIQNYRSPGSQAPIIAGGGGGVPSQQVPVNQLSGQDRRALIAQRLAQAAAQGR